MSRISQQLKLGLLLTTGLVVGTHDAFAQIEEVVVTARKREESLQAVPITVTAFSEEAINRQGIRTVAEVAKFTPGLNFDRGFAPQDTRPSIRGLPTTRGRPPVGILLDGIDISSESIGTAGGSNLMNLNWSMYNASKSSKAHNQHCMAVSRLAARSTTSRRNLILKKRDHSECGCGNV